MIINTIIWITGAKGRLDTSLGRILAKAEYQILLSDRDVPVEDLQAVNRFADMNHPDIIINCAGYTDVSLCEQNPEQAYSVNALGARNLAIAAQRICAKLIQISTDDVFDGNATTALNEFDEPHPVLLYGKSKFAGEKFVRELTDKHVIVRSSWIYGAGNHDFKLCTRFCKTR